MDSDDTLTLDAVETVLRYHRRYEDEKNICGYAFLRVHLDGNVNGKEFVPNERVASYTEARVGLFIEVACGAIVYAAVNMAMKNALIFEIIEKIKSKILCKN